jgi:hypothetical protein
MIERQLTALFWLSRLLKDETLAATDLTERLYSHLFGTNIFELSRFGEWEQGALSGGVHFAGEISALYARRYHDPRVIPVTYYKREKRIRRHLDHQFSLLFDEVRRRAGTDSARELITAEPIYYLMQIARERGFPKDRDGHANLTALSARIHLDLARRLGVDDREVPSRKVLLPHEIKRG